MSKAKILIFDIETSPIEGFVWGLFDNNLGLNQVNKDWSILSYSAKWLGSKKIFYEDTSKRKNVRDDSKLLKGIWKLLDEADAVITQNGNKFDIKKLNARFVMHGMQPPSSFKKIDTLLLAKKAFGFTSNKLEYMTDKLCTKYKKLQHKKYPGFELWSECLKGNKSAWAEMKKYNIHDVLSLEELYTKIAPWGTPINLSHYSDSEDHICSCGGKKFFKNGYYYTPVSRFIRLRCKDCGAEIRERVNTFSKEKKKSIKVGTVR
jgi:Aeromonas phage DNA polymerase exonuclease subunit